MGRETLDSAVRSRSYNYEVSPNLRICQFCLFILVNEIAFGQVNIAGLFVLQSKFLPTFQIGRTFRRGDRNLYA